MFMKDCGQFEQRLRHKPLPGGINPNPAGATFQ